MSFGEKLKTLRKELKLTQQQLAERVGVAKSVVSYYESVKLARIFHVTTDYLLDIERNRVLDVSDLSEEDIFVLQTVATALRNKH